MKAHSMNIKEILVNCSRIFQVSACKICHCQLKHECMFSFSKLVLAKFASIVILFYFFVQYGSRDHGSRDHNSSDHDSTEHILP